MTTQNYYCEAIFRWFLFDSFKLYDAMEEPEHGPVLPSLLKRRVSRVIPIGDILCNNVIQTQESKPPNPSEFVCIEPRSNPKPIFERKQNWLPEYIKQRRKDRIKWNSKLHHSENRFSRKSMYEQAEELMDIAANDFAECINKLSNDEEDKISEKMVKALFSIDIKRDISHSLNIPNVPLPAEHQQIAKLKNCPEVSIEAKIAKILKQGEKANVIAPKTHAFGRSLSPASQYRKRLEFSNPDSPRFPEEIYSGEHLFKGIESLKSTKALIKHLEDNNLMKPKYLRELCTLKMH